MRGGVTEQSTSDKARAAVIAFRRMQPTLTSYARVLTGKSDVRVEMSPTSNGMTDGKRIFLRPPLALGDNTPHDRSLCDSRDENKQQRCPACWAREAVLIAIYHEIGHIAFDTFANVTDEDRARLVADAVAQVDRKFARAVEQKIISAPAAMKNSYMGMAKLVSPFLPLLFNCIDDARVNRNVSLARKGTKIMFEADNINAFTKGIEQVGPDGKTIVMQWRDYPLNGQMSIGLYAKLSGFDTTDYLVPEIAEALADEEIVKLLRTFPNLRTPGNVYELSIKLLARLRELGFFKTETDPDVEPEKSEDDDEQDDQGAPGGESEQDPAESDDGPSEPGEEGGDGEDDAERGAGGNDRSDDEAEPDSGSDDDGEASSDGAGEDESDTEEAEGSGSSEGSDEDGSDAGNGGEVNPDDSAGGASSGYAPAGGDDLQGDAGDGESDGRSPEEGESDSTDGDSESDGEAEGDGESGQRKPEAGGDDGTPLDTGADEGLGGVELIENSAFDRLPMGEPEDIEGVIHEIAHPEERPNAVMEAEGASKEMERAVIQGLYFETPSRNIFGVREHKYGQPIILGMYNMSTAWDHSWLEGYSTEERMGIKGDFDPNEQTLGPALLKMRAIFAENKRGKDIRHKRSGRINARVLGKRAPLGDDRLFKHRIIPGKRSYFVLIGIDISGSTRGKNIMLAKRAALAQAELCARMGITFAVYAHSGKEHDPNAGRYMGTDLDIYFVKEADEPWSEPVKNRLRTLGPDSSNIDGHTMEYYRKILDGRKETDKILLYYTDGKMPAENYEEELEILRREIKVCRRKRYTLLGVGIRTDSPVRHGLDTVQVDGDEDVIKVVEHLERTLLSVADGR